MKNRLVIILGGIFISVLSIGAVTKVNEPEKYEFVTIVHEYNEITISDSNNNFEKINIKEEVKDYKDFRPMVKRLTEFQNKGWEIVENNICLIGQTSRNYALLRRVKK